jgi:hypothetical protein
MLFDWNENGLEGLQKAKDSNCKARAVGVPLLQEPRTVRPSTLERYDESAFCCSRVGHAACQPDLRSDRQQSDLWRLRLGTKLPLLWCESITRVVRGWVSRNTHGSVGIVRTK